LTTSRLTLFKDSRFDGSNVRFIAVITGLPNLCPAPPTVEQVLTDQPVGAIRHERSLQALEQGRGAHLKKNVREIVCRRHPGERCWWKKPV